MYKFDIPISIAVYAKTEKEAEKQVFDFMRLSSREFGDSQGVTDWEYFEFLVEGEDIGCSNLGCGNQYED